MSVASIEREKSSATTRSSPRCLAGRDLPGNCGRASATAVSPSAATISAARTSLRAIDTPAVIRATSAASPRRASRRRRTPKKTP